MVLLIIQFLSTETSVNLTITDQLTGCITSEQFILILHQPILILDLAGHIKILQLVVQHDSIILTANDSSNPNINWYVNNTFIGDSPTISTSLLAYVGSNTSVNVSLTLLIL